MDLNKVTLIGNLVRDPEVVALPSGKGVTHFSLATNYRWQDEEHHDQESVEFHDVEAFGKLGEIIASYVKKGSKVYIEGRLRTRKVGETRYTNIIADNMIMLGHRGKPEVPLGQAA
jgi:single-strand DNA-binding protein